MLKFDLNVIAKLAELTASSELRELLGRFQSVLVQYIFSSE